MRALFSVQPAYGHFHPMAPIAAALRAAGHEVLFVTAPPFVTTIEQAGFACAAAGLDWCEAEAKASFPELHIPETQQIAVWTGVVFGDRTLRATLPDLLEIAARWRPDIVVGEFYELAGPMVAEHTGRPFVLVETGPYLPAAGLAAAFGPTTAELRSGLGLPPDRDRTFVHDATYISTLPSRWQVADPRVVLPRCHVFRPAVFDRGPDSAGAPLGPRAPGGRPLVHVTLGTVFNKTPGVLEDILAGLGPLDVDVVATIGPNRDPSELGPQPSTVRVERYIPVSQILPVAAAVVTHGGLNTIVAALAHGCPLLVVPLSADQGVHAIQAVATGAGLALFEIDRTPVAITAAVRRLLDEPGFQASAVELMDEIAAQPPIEAVVEVLEALAG